MTTQEVLPDGQSVVLVPREQLRFKMHGRSFAIPYHLSLAVPTPPATFDHSRNESLKFPILGNDRYGDCYYAAVEHASQCYTGNSSTECQFDEQATINRYLKIAGGDNGLDDATIFAEWKAGIIGPSGPRKVLSVLTVPPNDAGSVALAMWGFGGLIWTASLANSWINTARPGAIWDAATPNPRNGHAMILTGINASGNYDVRTWGISPPVQVTKAGLRSCQPELIAAFSMDQFRTDGTSAFTGQSWEDMRQLWQTCGGRDVGPSPFPPTPIPPLPPVPPVPPVPPGTISIERLFTPEAIGVLNRLFSGK